MPRAGCERAAAASACRDGRPTAEAPAEDLSSMPALPGVAFDSVRWVGAKSGKRGYVEVCGNRYCAGPAWHDREPVVGVRAGSVEVLDGRGRRVAALRRSWGGTARWCATRPRSCRRSSQGPGRSASRR